MNISINADHMSLIYALIEGAASNDPVLAVVKKTEQAIEKLKSDGQMAKSTFKLQELYLKQCLPFIDPN